MVSGGESSDFLSYLNVLTGGALQDASIFGLSITPYINASIIMQLLTVAIPALERMAKEGNDGQKKIQTITRFVTLGLAVAMAIMYYFVLRNSDGVLHYYNGFSGVFSAIVIIASFVAGTMLVVWMGDQINEHGVGNGISVILFAGILSRGPDAFMLLWSWWQLGAEQPKYYFLVPAIIVIFIAIVAFIVFMTNAERRIPVSYAKRVVGRKMYGGQSTYIPIKVNMTGVLPIIFAMSFMSLPSMIESFVTPAEGGFWAGFFSLFHYNNIFYGVLYFLLILAFNYFYTAIQFNPVEIANSIRKKQRRDPRHPSREAHGRLLLEGHLQDHPPGGCLPRHYRDLPDRLLDDHPGEHLAGRHLDPDYRRRCPRNRPQPGSQITMRHHKGFLE